MYAALQHWPPDIFLFLIYEFREPSPHIINLRHVVLSAASMSIPLVVLRLSRDEAFEQKVELLRKLNVEEIVAGDVYIDEHLKYMERLADAVGAVLREPLWGMNSEDLLHREIMDGLKPVIIGANRRMPLKWLGEAISEENIGEFLDTVKRLGIDPIGERGEYHTLVIFSKAHREPLRVRVAKRVTTERQVIAILD